MNNYEYFQDDKSLDNAYTSETLDSTHNIPYCDGDGYSDGDGDGDGDVKDVIEKSTISNLWSFLGLSSLSKEKQGCLFDCSIHGARCLERCPNNSKKCNYKCLKHGLNCSKKCIVNKSTANDNSNNTKNIKNTKNTKNDNNSNNANNTNNTNNANNANNVNIPSGTKTYFDNYAPFDSTLWPGYNQTGWDIDKLETYNTNDLIEVLVPNQFPSETSKPKLLF